MTETALPRFGAPWLILITGLPGTGKSTLAAQLSRTHRLPLLAKDSIKEPLAGILAAEVPHSRMLSDAAFAALFRLAGQMLSDGVHLILEGNFRARAHAGALGALCSAAVAPRVLQILCRLPEPQRQARLEARAAARAAARATLDATTGHRASDLEDQTRYRAECDEFTPLPGERLLLAGGEEPDSSQGQIRMRIGQLLAAAR